MNKIKILIADDHRLVVQGFKTIIDSMKNFVVVAEAYSGVEVIEKSKATNPHVVLMDIDMPELNGLQATQKLAWLNPNIKVVILSMHSEKGMIQAAIEVGAVGYVLKNIEKNDFIEAIQKVAKGEHYYSSEVTKILSEKTGDPISKKQLVKNDENDHELTEREKEILTLIVDGFSNKQIGEKLFISHRTVDTHRTNLMRKLGVTNMAGLIRYGIQHGYID